MTYKELQTNVKRLGMIVRRNDGEIRISFRLECYNGTRAEQIQKAESEAYYTNDCEDAWLTAQYMRVNLTAKI